MVGLELGWEKKAVSLEGLKTTKGVEEEDKNEGISAVEKSLEGIPWPLAGLEQSNN